MNVERMRCYERGGARDCAGCWERNGETDAAANSNIATR
jgi:hypothetical protein